MDAAEPRGAEKAVLFCPRYTRTRTCEVLISNDKSLVSKSTYKYSAVAGMYTGLSKHEKNIYESTTRTHPRRRGSFYYI